MFFCYIIESNVGDSMDFYEIIRTMNQEERHELVDDIIKELSNTCFSKGIIGYKVDSNKENINNEDGRMTVEVRCLHAGFIKNDTKIIYGLDFSGDGYAANNGRYYYMNDVNYIYDFVDLLANTELEEDYDIFDLLLEYLEDYFGYFKKFERGDNFSLIVDKYGRQIEPIEDHDISWFKDNGNGMCTEYSSMAQNILSIIGYPTYLIIGSIDDDGDKGYHAFNFISTDEEDMLIDFSGHVDVFDLNYNKIGVSPYIIKLDDFGEDFLRDFVSGDIKVTSPDYDYVLFDDQLCKLSYDRTREYCVEDVIQLGNSTAEKKNTK